MTYVPKWATCERCRTFRPRSEMVRDPRLIRRWTCKSCPSEAPENGSSCTGDPCTCANGIGCVNIPVDQW